MSFGTTVRFETQKGDIGKPLIFWEKQAMEANKARKQKPFGTKSREQKFPVRSRNEATVQQTQRMAGKTNVAKKTGGDATMNKQAPRSKASSTKLQPNTVTLTQAQLEVILNSLTHQGQDVKSALESLASPNEVPSAHSGHGVESIINLTQKQLQVTDRYDTESPELIPKGSSGPMNNHVTNTYRNTNTKRSSPEVISSHAKEFDLSEIPGLGSMEPGRSPVAPSGGQENTAGRSNPTVPQGHMTMAQRKRLQWEKEREAAADAEAHLGPLGSTLLGLGPSQPHHTPLPTSEGSHVEHSPIPKAHLSKGELKRLQWQKEREEAEKQPPFLGRTLTQFWCNDPHPPTPSKGEVQASPGIPKGHMTKAERKRLEWERERAEVEERDTQQLRQRGLPTSHDQYRAPPGGESSLGGARVTMTKTQEKQLQWQKERAEIAERDTQQLRQRGLPTSHDQYRVPPGGESSLGGYGARVTMTKTEEKQLQWQKERAEQAQGWALTSSPANREVRGMSGDQYGGSPYIPQHNMSKMELKRRQWEEERRQMEIQAEQQADYDPWGRPGAGAPIRNTEGQVMADYNTRQDTAGGTGHMSRTPREAWSNIPTHTPPSYGTTTQGEPEAGDSVPPPPATSQPGIIQRERQQTVARPPAGGALQEPTFSPSGQALPAAMRSSIQIGIGTDDKYSSTKEREKQQWLQDLEKQREEKRLQKLREKAQRQQDDGPDTWADQLVGHKSQPLPAQVQHSPGGDVGVRANSAPQSVLDLGPGVDIPCVSPHGESQKFLRGQFTHMDEATRQKLEEKRKREHEHQDAIKKQVEEQKLQKARELARRRLEEQQEEHRLQAERDALSQVYEAERQKAREKEEQQRRRVEMLKEAMDAAAEEAHREKHEKRLRKLQQGGHDTTQLNAKFEDDNHPSTKSSTGLQTHNTEATMTPRPPPAVSDQVVEPSYVPGLDLTPRDHVTHDPYQVDKVIVPSKYKEHPSMPFTDPASPRREFGVQTELDLYSGGMSRESSGIEYKGPFKGNSNKKVRIKSGGGEQSPKKEPQKVTERPKWGASAKAKAGSPKKLKKQSEKDPYYEKRKEQREANARKRQKEMQEMVERNQKHVKEKVVLRARSKSRDRAKDANEGQGDRRSRSHSDPQGPGGRGPPSQVGSPSLQTHQGHRGQQSRGRQDTRSRSRKELQEDQVTNGYRSPPVPSLRKQTEPTEPLRTQHSTSPPVPAIKHRMDNDYNIDTYAYDATNNNNQTETHRSRYSDADLMTPGVKGDFVPFVRTANILDPSVAAVPLPLAKEPTMMRQAREGYVQSIKPASYGREMPNLKDPEVVDHELTDMPLMPEPWRTKDPIINPSLVTDHPTGRQDRILQQLSDLRKGLMQKQRELETMSPMSAVMDPY